MRNSYMVALAYNSVVKAKKQADSFQKKEEEFIDTIIDATSKKKEKMSKCIVLMYDELKDKFIQNNADLLGQIKQLNFKEEDITFRFVNTGMLDLNSSTAGLYSLGELIKEIANHNVAFIPDKFYNTYVGKLCYTLLAIFGVAVFLYVHKEDEE